MPADIVFAEDKKTASELGYDKLIVIGKNAFAAKTSQEINKNRSKFDYILSKILWEDKRVDIAFDFEDSKKKDFMHHRASGLNQVVAKQLAKNKTAFAFNFSSVLHTKDRSIVIGRMIQNVVVCRKYKVKMIIASFAKAPIDMRNPKDLQAFGVILGMTPKEAKEAVNF